MKEKLIAKLNNIDTMVTQVAANLNALYGRKFELEELLKELEKEEKEHFDSILNKSLGINELEESDINNLGQSESPGAQNNIQS